MESKFEEIKKTNGIEILREIHIFLNAVKDFEEGKRANGKEYYFAITLPIFLGAGLFCLINIFGIFN